MAWEEDSCICLNMQLIAILSRIGVEYIPVPVMQENGGCGVSSAERIREGKLP